MGFWLDRLTSTILALMVDPAIWGIMVAIAIVSGSILAYFNNLDQKRANVLTAIIVVVTGGWYWLMNYAFGSTIYSDVSWKMTSLTLVMALFLIIGTYIGRWLVSLRSDPRGKILNGMARLLERIAADFRRRAEVNHVKQRAEAVIARGEQLIEKRP